MLQLHYKTFDLKLRHTFKIAHDERDIQQTLIVGLTDGRHWGFGEATANRYYDRPVEGMIEVLESARSMIESCKLEDVSEFMQCVSPQLFGNSFVVCALDVAAHDLLGRREGRSLREIWGLGLGQGPKTNYTIGIDTIPKMLEKMDEVVWPLYKIKLGTPYDLEIVQELRQHTDAKFRVDANCAWTSEETIRYSKELKQLGVEFIEQPLQADNWEGMREVFEKSALPVIADESCIQEEDVEACLTCFHGINVKLMKCGGLLPARRMITKARQAGKKVMVGCMTESSVGISAIGQLLPLLDYVDMDGPLLISNDIATGPIFDQGRVTLPERPGTGVELKKPWK